MTPVRRTRLASSLFRGSSGPTYTILHLVIRYLYMICLRSQPDRSHDSCQYGCFSYSDVLDWRSNSIYGTAQQRPISAFADRAEPSTGHVTALQLHCACYLRRGVGILKHVKNVYRGREHLLCLDLFRPRGNSVPQLQPGLPLSATLWSQSSPLCTTNRSKKA